MRYTVSAPSAGKHHVARQRGRERELAGCVRDEGVHEEALTAERSALQTLQEPARAACSSGSLQPGLIDTIAPASAITESPESSDSVASVYVGPYWMRCSIACLLECRRREDGN